MPNATAKQTVKKTAKASKPEQTPEQTPEPAKVEPPATPEPHVEIETTQVPQHRPTVRTPDGQTLTCPHRMYGHETEKSAQRCARVLIARSVEQTAA